MPSANLESDDYYENLGLDRKATAAEIKSAYRKLAIQYHPDKNLMDKERAEANFKIVGEAYNILINKETRATYDIYGKDGLQDGMEPITKETALRIFREFFRYGEAMDPEAPERAKGIRRAAGGMVYAPVKGILYGGRSVLMGVALSSTAVALGAKNMVQSVASGVKEMGEAGVHVAKQRRRHTDSELDKQLKTQEASADYKDPPSFMGGLKKATVGAISAPVAAFVSGGSVLLASGVAASGFIVGGFAGAASNVASGVCEVQAANRIEKAQRRLQHQERVTISSSET